MYIFLLSFFLPLVQGKTQDFIIDNNISFYS